MIGRVPVNAFCRTCNTLVTTQVQNAYPQKFADHQKKITLWTTLGGIIGGILFVYLTGPKDNNLQLFYYALIIFGILFVVMLCSVLVCNPNVLATWPDIQHKCPNCQQLLGVSDGYKAYKIRPRPGRPNGGP